MPSMSYCAFENTTAEMQQCENMIGEAIDDGVPLDLNRYERPFFDNMKERAQQLIALLEQYEDHFAEYDAEEQGIDHAGNWSDTSAELA